MLRRAFITSTRRAVSGSQFTVTQRFYSKPFFFTQDHEWAQETDSLVRTGISDVAQNKLGEIIHLEFQVEQGATVNKGDVIAEVESVKAVSEIYSPVSGKIVKLNDALNENSSLLNTSPENEGWIVEINADNFAGQQGELLTADKYKEFCATEDH